MVRRKIAALSTMELAAAFGMKVIFGCLYGYIFYHYYGGDDTWDYNRSSLLEQKLLLENPGAFFNDLNPLVYFNRNDNLGAAIKDLLGNWEYSLITKPMAVFNFISGGNYYINIVYFSFVSFWGQYWLFSLLTQSFPEKRKLFLLLIFFFPPAVFWLSGIRGDGLLLFFMALLLYQFRQWLLDRRRQAVILALLGFAGVLIIRNAVALCMAPALAGWYLAQRNTQKTWTRYLAIYGIGIILFFSSALLSARYSGPAMVAARQAEYLELHGNTRFRLDRLDASLPSFVKVLPQAVANTFFRPLPWEARGVLQLMSALDILLFWGLAAYCFFRRSPDRRRNWDQPLIPALLLAGLSLYIFIGYTVPFPGAIVRYKILPELFLYACLVVAIRPRNIK